MAFIYCKSQVLTVELTGDCVYCASLCPPQLLLSRWGNQRQPLSPDGHNLVYWFSSRKKASKQVDSPLGLLHTWEGQCSMYVCVGKMQKAKSNPFSIINKAHRYNLLTEWLLGPDEKLSLTLTQWLVAGRLLPHPLASYVTNLASSWAHIAPVHHRMDGTIEKNPARCYNREVSCCRLVQLLVILLASAEMASLVWLHIININNGTGDALSNAIETQAGGYQNGDDLYIAPPTSTRVLMVLLSHSCCKI